MVSAPAILETSQYRSSFSGGNVYGLVYIRQGGGVRRHFLFAYGPFLIPFDDSGKEVIPAGRFR